MTGRALDNGRPVAVSIYVFHADADGLYSRDGRNSDENARRSRCVRTRRGATATRVSGPAGMATCLTLHQVINTGYKPRLFDLWFGDDPAFGVLYDGVTSLRRKSTSPVTGDLDGVWHVTHDIEMLRESN